MISHGARMTFDRFSRLASIPAVVFCLLVYTATCVQAATITLLRDADIEQGLSRLAAPVLRAAGLNAKRLRILVVNDSQFNAFVLDSRAIFINYGLILKVSSPEMLQAVIAHEAAHITNGHIARRMQNLQSAGTAAGLGLALAALAAAAGAGEAAGGIAIGTQTSALRGFCPIPAPKNPQRIAPPHATSRRLVLIHRGWWTCTRFLPARKCSAPRTRIPTCARTP